MKKSTLVLFLILSGCAKERTTQYYSGQGQSLPLSSVQTAMKTEVKVESETDHNPNVISLNNTTAQEDLEILFNSYEAPEVHLPKPEGVICEIIPQLRIQKTLGRLTCMKQTPMVTDVEVIKKGTSMDCSIDLSRTPSLITSDEVLYQSLTLAEELEPHGHMETTTYRKKIGHFYCDKIIKNSSGAVSYDCSINMMYSGSFN
jgi:hypothetical protein